jgi:hypothetical protein
MVFQLSSSGRDQVNRMPWRGRLRVWELCNTPDRVRSHPRPLGLGHDLVPQTDEPRGGGKSVAPGAAASFAASPGFGMIFTVESLPFYIGPGRIHALFP